MHWVVVNECFACRDKRLEQEQQRRDARPAEFLTAMARLGNPGAYERRVVDAPFKLNKKGFSEPWSSEDVRRQVLAWRVSRVSESAIYYGIDGKIYHEARLIERRRLVIAICPPQPHHYELDYIDWGWLESHFSELARKIARPQE
jgi:hypothetical protein